MNARLFATVHRDREAMDRAADALVSLDNRDRYLQQSAATVAGHPAPFPQRAPLSLDGVRADFDKLFGVTR